MCNIAKGSQSLEEFRRSLQDVLVNIAKKNLTLRCMAAINGLLISTFPVEFFFERKGSENGNQ